MPTVKEETSGSPGVMLANFVRNRLSNIAVGRGFHGAADEFFDDDGVLERAEKERVVSYTVRRIIHGVRFMMESSNVSSNETERMLDCIKKYLNLNTSMRLDDGDLNEIKDLIFATISISSKKMSNNVRASIVKKAKAEGVSKCYICGDELDFDVADTDQSAEVEHIFPYSFGGESNQENLRLSCGSCNSQKRDSIGNFDFNFERISTRHDCQHKHWKKRLFESPNALAILLKEDCRCSTCGRSAAEVGKLKAFRFEERDSWHYLNIGMNCYEH